MSLLLDLQSFNTVSIVAKFVDEKSHTPYSWIIICDATRILVGGSRGRVTLSAPSRPPRIESCWWIEQDWRGIDTHTTILIEPAHHEFWRGRCEALCQSTYPSCFYLYCFSTTPLVLYHHSSRSTTHCSPKSTSKAE
jgi:hypothetical protein